MSGRGLTGERVVQVHDPLLRLLGSFDRPRIDEVQVPVDADGEEVDLVVVRVDFRPPLDADGVEAEG